MRTFLLAGVVLAISWSAPAPAQEGGEGETAADLATLQGKWTYIWNLDYIHGGDPEAIVDELLEAGVAGVALKANDGAVTLDSPELAEFIETARDAGIRVGFWGYVYLDQPEEEADAAAYMIQRYAGDLDFYLIDAEGEAKGRYEEAAEYAARLDLHVDGHLPVGLASYRFPAQHADLPWDELRAIADFDSPQVYYRNADPVQNLLDSYAAYQSMDPPLPYFPAGDMYAEHGLVPTPEAVTAYLELAMSLPGVNGSLMWYMDQMHRNPQLWEAFASVEWAVDPAVRSLPPAGLHLDWPPSPPASVSGLSLASAGGKALTLSWTSEPATARRIVMEVRSGDRWIPYYTWEHTTGLGEFRFNPSNPNLQYRVRVQVGNGTGWGAMSDWYVFDPAHPENAWLDIAQVVAAGGSANAAGKPAPGIAKAPKRRPTCATAR